MSRSIPDTLGDRPRFHPGRRQICSYCGVEWYTSDLTRDAAGMWVCPDDRDGRDTVTLNRLNQQAALAARRPNRGPSEW